MGKKLDIGVNNIARKGKAAWIGVDNVARKIKKMWIGDENGIARLFYDCKNGLNYIFNKGIWHYDTKYAYLYSPVLEELNDSLATVNTYNVKENPPENWGSSVIKSKDLQYAASVSFTINTTTTSVITRVFKWNGSGYTKLYDTDIGSVIKSKLRAASSYVSHSCSSGNCVLSPDGAMLFIPVYTLYKYNGNTYYTYINIFVFDVTDTGLTYRATLAEYTYNSPGKSLYTKISIQFSDDSSYVYVWREGYYYPDSGATVYMRHEELFYLQPDGTYSSIYRVINTDDRYAQYCGGLFPNGKYLMVHYNSNYSSNSSYSNSHQIRFYGLKDGEIISDFTISTGSSTKLIPSYMDTINSRDNYNTTPSINGFYYNEEAQILIQQESSYWSSGSYTYYTYSYNSYSLSDIGGTSLGKFQSSAPMTTQTDLDTYFYLLDMSDDMKHSLSYRGVNSSKGTYLDDVSMDANNVITAVTRKRLIHATTQYYESSLSSYYYTTVYAKFINM